MGYGSFRKVFYRLTKDTKFMKKKFAVLAMIVVAMFTLSSCALISKWGEDFARDWKGVSATMTTYDEDGQSIIKAHGGSLQIKRDEDFDTVSSGSDGTSSSNKDSQVLKITIGGETMHHVGSTLVLAEDGLEDLSPLFDSRFEIENKDRGVPVFNYILEKHRNMWQGKSKAVMIYSQSGKPIAVYAGKHVEQFATDVPKSTQFRIDGKLLLVYRADMSTVPTALTE